MNNPTARSAASLFAMVLISSAGGRVDAADATSGGVTAGSAGTLTGGRAIGISGVLPDFEKVEIASGRVYDYTFASAPTDWRVQSGVWEMTNRWSCSPGWSWFGGRSDETAAVWHKRKFSGDISVQFYFAFKMGLAGTTAWKYHPSDMGITIGGDGRNLNSGYSFVVGAEDNARSVLMRGDRVVAQNSSPEALLPSFVDGNPDAGHKSAMLHHRWWYARIDKIGNRVSCFLDNRLLFTYEDPTPLDSGQIALWTYNNGIMLSRVQVFYAHEIQTPFLRRAAAPLPAEDAASASAAVRPVAANRAVPVRTSPSRTGSSRPPSSRSTRTVKIARTS